MYLKKNSELKLSNENSVYQNSVYRIKAVVYQRKKTKFRNGRSTT